MNTYCVVRFYFRAMPYRQRVLERGLSLAEAQVRTQSPEASSQTATGSKARARTRRMGPWFDGYRAEK